MRASARSSTTCSWEQAPPRSIARNARGTLRYVSPPSCTSDGQEEASESYRSSGRRSSSTALMLSSSTALMLWMPALRCDSGNRRYPPDGLGRDILAPHGHRHRCQCQERFPFRAFGQHLLGGQNSVREDRSIDVSGAHFGNASPNIGRPPTPTSSGRPSLRTSTSFLPRSRPFRKATFSRLVARLRCRSATANGALGRGARFIAALKRWLIPHGPSAALARTGSAGDHIRYRARTRRGDGPSNPRAGRTLSLSCAFALSLARGKSGAGGVRQSCSEPA